MNKECEFCRCIFFKEEKSTLWTFKRRKFCSMSCLKKMHMKNLERIGGKEILYKKIVNSRLNNGGYKAWNKGKKYSKERIEKMR